MGKRGPAKGDPRMIELGRQRGQAVKEKFGVEYFSLIGKRGGETTKQLYGTDYFSQIGRKGGQVTKTLADYHELGKRGAEVVRQKKARNAEPLV